MEGVISRLKYPKLLLLILTFVVAYFMFSGKAFLPFRSALVSLSYVGAFISGFFFTYGFTSAPATAMLLILAKEVNVPAAGFIAGLGALAGDLVIFKIVRYSLADEIKRLSKERVFGVINHRIPRLFRKYAVATFAGFIIASPLPDEIGVSLLAGATKISTGVFSIVSYLLNTFGILVVLAIGSKMM